MNFTTIVVFAPLLILGSALVFAALAAADLQDRTRPRIPSQPVRAFPRRTPRVDLPRAA